MLNYQQPTQHRLFRPPHGLSDFPDLTALLSPSRPSTCASPTASPTLSCAPTGPSSTRSTLSATGGTTLTAPASQTFTG